MFPETVTTDRLRLEQLSSAVDPLEFYRYAGRPREPDIAEETRHVTWSPHSTPKESFDVLRQFDERWEDGEAATYAVFPREGEERAGEFAGDTGLSVEWEKRSAELGIWLRRRFWGRGYSGERAVALVELAFDRLDLDLMRVSHDTDNRKSRRAVERYVERLGGRRDGTFRNYLANHDGTPCDQTCYSISRRRNFRRNAQPCDARNSSMVRRRTIEISGMSCDGCERAVQNALKNVAGVRRAEADHGAGTVEVVAEDDVTDDDLGDAVRNAGYEVVA